MESYFGGVWQDQNFANLKYSGYQLVEYVNGLNPRSVLDIGCGYNRFKNKIHKLIGVDPYNKAADIPLPLEKICTTMKYDVVLALGSINFGDESVIDNQMEIIDKIFDREAIFRVNPGIPHDWADVADIQGIYWYPWTKDKIYAIADHYKYNVKRFEEEHVSQGHLRYFFIYTK